MRKTTQVLIAFLFGAILFGGAQASADYRPDPCRVDHDHRSHDANYYDYYKKDRYYRAGPYRASRSFNGNRRYYRDDRYYDRRRGYDSYYSRPRSRVVSRETYRTGYRAKIVVVEEVYYTRSGREQLVCTVIPRGPEAYYIPRKKLKWAARRGCSRYARMQYR